MTSSHPASLLASIKLDMHSFELISYQLQNAIKKKVS